MSTINKKISIGGSTDVSLCSTSYASPRRGQPPTHRTPALLSATRTSDSSHATRTYVDYIITSYNSKKIIGDCLESVKKQTHKDWTCTVIDDGSTDSTVEYIKKSFPWARVIANADNKGPSIRRNEAIAATKHPLIAILDSDIVLDPKWTEKQIAFLEREPYCGIAGSKLVYFDEPKRLNASAGGLFSFGIGFDEGAGKPATSFTRPKRCMYVCSAALLMKRSMVKKIGAFDPTYFYGHEDTDLGWRANIAGYSVWSNPNALAKHRVSATMKHYSSRVYYHARKNWIRSALKNYQIWNVFWAVPVLVLLEVADLLVRGPRFAKLKGLLWNVPHIFDTLRERRKVQLTRAVSDAGLWVWFSGFSWKRLLGF